jgi:hypothetical protein
MYQHARGVSTPVSTFMPPEALSSSRRAIETRTFGSLRRPGGAESRDNRPTIAGKVNATQPAFNLAQAPYPCQRGPSLPKHLPNISAASPYVGVGTVLESVQPVKDFKVQTDGAEQPALVALKHADKYRLTAEDPERAEYFVRVRWLDTVPENKAVNEVPVRQSEHGLPAHDAQVAAHGRAA